MLPVFNASISQRLYGSPVVSPKATAGNTEGPRARERAMGVLLESVPQHSAALHTARLPAFATVYPNGIQPLGTWVHRRLGFLLSRWSLDPLYSYFTDGLRVLRDP